MSTKSKLRKGAHTLTRERERVEPDEKKDGIPLDVFHTRRREQERLDREELLRLRQEYNDFKKRSGG